MADMAWSKAQIRWADPEQDAIFIHSSIAQLFERLFMLGSAQHRVHNVAVFNQN